MIFKKNKKMIDVRELQRRGVVKLPEKEIVIPTDKTGFVDFSGKGDSVIKKSSKSQNNADFFGFTGIKRGSGSLSSSTGEGYDKREVDEKVTNLDNKIYKLEQRIELLERKLGVGSSVGSGKDGSLIGW